MEPPLLVSDLFTLSDAASDHAAFHIAPRRPGRRCLVTTAQDTIGLSKNSGWWAEPGTGVGDTPKTYNVKYVMAVLSSKAGSNINSHSEPAVTLSLAQWELPHIGFETDEFTRRSMTLNGMRMSTEYFTSGSPRVLQLIAQRLAAGQRDVVHDVLVYLMEAVLDARSQAREARLLRAESVAAYLGLHHQTVGDLFLEYRLVPEEISTALEAGAAGELRRSIDVSALIESQVRHLRPALRHYRHQERQVLLLIDEVVGLLYTSSDV